MTKFYPLCLLASVAAAAGCTVQRPSPNLKGQDIRLTIIHTSDIHSRLFPYKFVPGRNDQDLGLSAGQGPYGGIARIGAIVKRERAAAGRSLWLDSGDCFQGAPIFNIYKGEAEMRVLSELGLDAAVIGNHEFDLGANNFYEQVVNWATFPLLAANYYFEDPSEPGKPKLREIVQPFQIFDVDGVRVGVIGMANVSTITSLSEGGNSLGIRGISEADTVKAYVGMLRPVCDLVVLVSHLGLEEDEGLSASQVVDPNEALPIEGVDLILGGHLHVVLNPPKVINTDEYGHPTVVAHSGAFAKFVGRLDLVVKMGSDNSRPEDRSYISAYAFEPIPVMCGRRDDAGECMNPSDPDATALLQPYALELNSLLDLDGVFAYVSSEDKVVRNDQTGGDSQLGNLVARSMQLRNGVDADFAFTNSLGIRADFEQGPLTLEDLYNVFPFENSITIMFLSGSEVRETLDFVAEKSSERGCRTQVQVAGLYFTMVCGNDPHAEDIYIGDGCRNPDGSIDTTKCTALIDEGLYRVAVNDYIAAGGSGFTVLKRNTSKVNTGIALRASLQDYIRGLPTCPADFIDETDPELRPVQAVYGPITCLDAELEAHDARILPVFQ
jgi:5'-nucleotidase / UDP-sugar diphosphatase